MALKNIPEMATLEVAAEIIPMPSVGALRFFLFNHKDQFPAVYRNTHIPGAGTFTFRMLTEQEILKIREMTINEKPGRFIGGRPLGMKNGQGKNYRGPLASVFRKLEAQRG